MLIQRDEFLLNERFVIYGFHFKEKLAVSNNFSSHGMFNAQYH